MERPVYRFGECSIDPAARELRRNGGLVVLSPKVFDCMAYLIERRERAVGRDELTAAVWERADVSDALLGQVLLKARRAVGDTGGDQQAIRTIPRFGYRWVAPVRVEQREEAPGNAFVEASDAAEVEPIADRLPDAPAARRVRWHTVAAFSGLAIATALLALAWIYREAPAPANTSAPTASPIVESGLIAVLPVAVEASPDWSWLRLGLMYLFAVHLRDAGLAVVPSDNIVALMQTSGADPATAAMAIRTTTGARRLLTPTATSDVDGWRVHLALHDEAGDIAVEARDADAVTASRAAVALLLARLGKSASAGGAETASVDDLLQRAEAAMLADELDTARRVIDAAPAALRNVPEVRLRRALIDLRAARLEPARENLAGLLRDVDAETAPVLRARALTIASSVAIHSSDIAAATQACDEAVALLANRNQPAALGRAYTACGVAAASAGRFDAAMTDFALARVAFEVTGDALSLARIEANEGAMESTRGRYAEGVVAMRRSEERFRALGARSESLQSIRNQVDAQLALLQPQEALATAMRGRSLLSQVQNVDLRCAMQAQVARALAANGRIDEATALLAQTATEVTPGQERTVLGQIRSTQASLELASERALDAAAHARMAVDALASPDDARERAQAWATLVRALASSGDPEAAAGQSASLLDWSTRSSVSSAHVYARLTDAERRWSPQRDAAMVAYDGALTAAEATGVPADIAAVARSWGAVLLAAGDRERASAVVGRLTRWAANDFDCSVALAGLYRALGQGPPWQAALVRARALAGERPIPVSATAAAD